MSLSAVSVVSLILSILRLVVILIGVVLVLVTRRRHPRRSTLAAVGLGVMLIAFALQAFGPSLFAAAAADVAQFQAVMLAVNVTTAILQVIGWALLFAALLARERGGRAPAWAGPSPPWPLPPPFPQGGTPIPPGQFPPAPPPH